MASFMSADLVVWIQTFWDQRDTMTYANLTDGGFLNRIFKEIDPNAALEGVIPTVEDVKDRMQNWDILWRNMRTYYSDVLQQTVVMQPPNIVTISREPDSVHAQEEVEKALLFLLGAAVQCERKDFFIRSMLTQLKSEKVQSGIMACIKEITENPSNVVSFGQEPESGQLMKQLREVAKQRDAFYLEDARDLLHQLYAAQQEVNTLHAQLHGKGSTHVVGSASERHHLGVELAECKAKMRRMRADIDEKTEQVSELREELLETRSHLTKAREETGRLSEAARSVRTLRDEADALRERAAVADRLEVETARLKERLNEAEFYRGRCQELREDLAVVVEEKAVLVEEAERNRKVVEAALDVESLLRKARDETSELLTERAADRERLAELQEEVTRLTAEQRSTLNESANLEAELERARYESGGKSGAGGSLSEQLADTANARILRLELENRRLQSQLDQMRVESSSGGENTARVKELERENMRLAEKVKKLQESSSSEVQQVMLLVEEKADLQQACDELKVTMETMKENYERQVMEVTRENDGLEETLRAVRARSDKSIDLRERDLEKENRRLHANVGEVTAKLAKLELEHRQLTRSHERAKDSVNKVRQLEADMEKLSLEKSDFQRQIATLQVSCERYDELERSYSTMEVEKECLEKSLESFRSSLSHKDQVEMENVSLKAENSRLKRTTEGLKTSTSRVAELEAEKEALKSQLATLTRQMQAVGGEKKRLAQLESDLFEMDTDNQKLQRQLEGTNKKVEAMEKDLSNGEEENARLSRSIEQLRMSLWKAEEVERESSQLADTNQILERDKATLEKEVRRLRRALELKETSLDEVTVRSTQLEAAKKQLESTLSNGFESDARTKELEKENRELVQTLSMEKKTVSAMREELVNAKIKCQQLTNERDEVNQELEKIGLNREKLQMAQDDHIERKYQALETMMEMTVKETVSKKEQRIVALESRLEESKSRNQNLSEELRTRSRDMAALQQRYEEETAGRSTSSVNGSPSRLSNSSNLFQLKDRLVELERQNARFESENSSLQSSNADLQERLRSTESRSSMVQDQVMKLQAQTGELLAQNAKLQVESTTLESKVESLQTQNTRCQDQYAEMESAHNTLLLQLEEAQSCQTALVVDHEQLSRLHGQLSSDYERLNAEASKLRNQTRALKQESTASRDEIALLKRDADSVKHLREALEREKDTLHGESRHLVSLREECARLSDERHLLCAARDNAEAELRVLQSDYRNLRREHADLQSRHEQAQMDLGENREQLTQLDLEVAKLASKCEALGMLNHKLEEENKSLLLQLQNLLSQNQDLLTQTLESKEHHFSEEQTLRERLSSLQRHKERLEEKIMEQYKSYPSVKKNKSFPSNFMRRARGILAKRRESKENLKTDDDNRTPSMKMAQRSISLVTLPTSASGSSPKGHKRTTSHRSQTPTRSLLGAKSSEDLSQDNDDRSSGPIPQLRTVHGEGLKKLIPGSVSIYDRSPEEGDTSSLHEFLMELNRRKEAENMALGKEDDQDAGFGSDWPLRPESRGRGAITPTPGMGMPRSRSGSAVLEIGQPRRQLPCAPEGPPPARTTSKPGYQGVRNGVERATSVPPERMMPRSSSTVSAPAPAPSPPERKASLPVTDRCEKDIYDPNSASGSPSDASQTSQRTSRAESATSKAIISRLMRGGGPLPQRPATAIDFMRSGVNGDVVMRPCTPRAEVVNSPRARPTANPSGASIIDATSPGLRSLDVTIPDRSNPASMTVPRRGSYGSTPKIECTRQPAPPRRTTSQSVAPPPPQRVQSSNPGAAQGSPANQDSPPDNAAGDAPKKPAVWYEYGNV